MRHTIDRLLLLGCAGLACAWSSAVSQTVPVERLLAMRADSLAQRFSANRADRSLFVAAIATADSALVIDSTLVAAHAARAGAFAAAGQPRDAAAAYRRALALDSDNARIANASLGQFWRAGFYDEAYRWSKRQAEREPTNLAVLFNYNVASGFLIEPQRAESLMRRALEINPRFATAHGELAFLAQYGGRRAEAVQHMREALALDTTSAENRGGLAQMLIPTGDPRAAAALLAPVAAKTPGATAYGGRSVLAIYGWALKALGDTAADTAFEAALARLKNREQSGETTYQLFREMAAIYAVKGDRANAVRALQRAAVAGLHTYASWDLSDPMLASIRYDADVERLVAAMREDTRRMRANAGLP